MSKIAMKCEFVDGTFDTDTGKMICVPSFKHASVDLCFKTDNGMNVGFARIKLYGRDRFVDAQAVFEDASILGEEICKRWNAAATITAIEVAEEE